MHIEEQEEDSIVSDLSDGVSNPSNGAIDNKSPSITKAKTLPPSRGSIQSLNQQNQSPTLLRSHTTASLVIVCDVFNSFSFLGDQYRV